MSERLPEWQPLGIDIDDLADSKEETEVAKTPEQERLEHKAAEYKAIAEILAHSVDYLKERVRDETAGSLIEESVIKSLLNSAITNAEAEITDQQAREIMDHAFQVTSQSDYVGDTPKISLHQTIEAGMNTGAQVLAAYWQTIIDTYGINKLHEIGTHPRTLGTIAAIVRAWSLPELGDKMRDLGRHRADGGQPPYMDKIPDKFFIFEEDSVRVSPELKALFESEYSNEHVGCPVGHKVGIPEHDGETATVIPVKEYARIILDEWQVRRQKLIDTL